MKILKLFMCVAFILSDTAPLYAEVMFDRPMYQPSGTRSSFRSPQEIIADFQASVDKIQREQEDLYGQIDSKNKENAFLLRKINSLSVKLLELERALSKRSSQDSQSSSEQVAKITAEKELLLKKYNEVLSQKLKLESEIEKLSSERQNVEEKVESGVATLKEALNSSQEEIARQKAQIDALVKEKESLEQEQRQVLEDRSAVQSRLQSLEVQNRELKENAADVAALRQSPLQQRVRELSDRVDELRETLREKDRLIVQAKKRESESLSYHKIQEKEKDNLRKQIRLLTSTYNSAQKARAAKITRLESEIKQKQNEIERLSRQGEQKQKDTVVPDPERKVLEQQIARLKENLRTEQAAFERKLEKAKSPFLLQIEALQKTLDEKTSDLLKKNKDLESLRSKSNALSKELDETRKQKEALARSVSNLEKKISKSSDDLRDPEQALRTQILSLRQELDKRDDQLEEESRRVNELEAQKKELSMSIESVNREKEFLQKEVGSFQAQFKDDRSGAVDQNEEVRKEYEQKMAFLSAEIKELEEKLSAGEKKIADQVKETNRQKEEMQATINSLSDELGKERSSTVAETVTNEKSAEQKDQIGKLTIDKLKLEKELSETIDERRQFESELTALKIKYDALEADMPEKMRQARAPLEENIAKLKMQLEEQTKNLEDKNLLAADLKEQNQTLKSALRKNTDEREDFKQQIGYLEDLLEKTKSEVAQINGKNLPAHSSKVDVITKELEEANKALKDKDALISELKDENKELGQRLGALEQDRSAVQRSAQKLTDELEEMKKSAQNVTEDVDVRSKKVIDDLKRSLADSKQALKIQENLVKTLNTKIADLGIEVRKLTDEGVQLRSSLTGAKEDKSRLEKELNDFQAKVQQKLHDQSAFFEQGQIKAVDLDVKQKASDDNAQALQVQEDLVKTLNTKIADLGMDIRRLTDEGVELRSSLASAKDEKVRLENELSALQSKLDQTTRDLSERSKIVPMDPAVIEKERDKVLAQLKEVTQDRDDLKKDLEASQQQQKKMQDEFVLLVQKHETEMSGLKDQKTKFDEQLAEAARRAATFEKTIAHLNDQLDEARAKRSDQNKENRSQWQQKIDALTADLEESKDRSAELERSLKDLKVKNEQLNALAETSQRSLSEKDKSTDVLDQARKELAAQAALFDKERQGFQSTIKALTQQIATLQTAQTSELTAVKSESAQKTAELAKKLADAVGEIRVKEGTVGQMTIRQNSLEQQLSDALLAKSRAETSAKQAQSEVETLRKEFEAEKARMKDDVLRFGSERDDQIIKVNELQNLLKDAQKQTKSAVDQAREPLIKQIEELKAQMKKSDAELQDIKTANKQLDQTKDDLVKQLEASQLKQKDIQAKFDEWKNAISDKEMKNRGAVVNVERELNAKISAITAQLTESGKRSDELRTIREDLERTVKAQGVRIADLEAQLAGKDKELLSQRSKISEDLSLKDKNYEQQISKLTEELDASRKAVAELSRSNEILQGDVKARETRGAQLEAEIEDKQTTIAALQDQLAGDVMTVKRSSESKITELTGELASSQDLVGQLTKAKNELERSLNEAQGKLEEMSKDISARTSQWQKKLADQEKALQSTDDRVRAPLMKEIEGLKKQISENALQVGSLTAQNKELSRAKEELTKELAAVQAKEKENQIKMAGVQEAMINKSAQDRQALISMEKDLKVRIEEITSQLAASQAQADELNRSKQELEKALKSKEETIARLEVEAIERQNTLSMVDAKAKEEIAVSKKASDGQVAQLNAKLKDQERSILELTRSKESIEEALRSKEARIAEIENEISQKDKALAALKTQSSQDVVSAKQELSARLEELASQKKAADAQVQRLEADLQTARKSIDDLIKSRESLESAAENNEKQIAGLQAQIIEKDKAVSVIKSQASSELTTAQNKMNSQIETLTEQLNDQKASVAELLKTKESLEAALNKSEIQLAQANAKAADKEDQLASAQEQLSAQVETLKGQLNNEQETVVFLTKAREDLEAALKASEAKLAQANAKAAEKEDQLASAQDQFNVQGEALQGQLKEEQQTVIFLRKAKEDLETELKKSEAQLAQANAMAAEKEDQLASAQDQLNGQIETLTDQLNNEKELVAGLRKNKESLEAALKASETKLAQAIADAAGKDAAVKALEAEVSSRIATAKKPLEEKIDILVKSLGDAQAEVKTKEGAINSLNTKVSGLERSLNETSTAKVTVEKESAQTKAELEKTRNDMAVEIQKANKPLIEKNQVLQIESGEKTKKITALTAERDRLAAESATLAEDKRKLQQDFTLLKQEIDKQKRALEENATVVKAPLLAQIAQLQKTIDEKDLLIEQKAEAFSKVNGELATVLKGLAVIREDRDKMSAMVKPLQAQIKAIPQEVALAKAPLEEENSLLKVELEKVQGMLDVRVKGLEADIERKTADHERAEADRIALEKEIARVSQSNNELSQDMEKLQLKLSKKFQEDCGVALEEIQKPWKDKIDQLKAQIEGKDKEIESFKNENLRLNQELGEVLNEAPAGR